MDKEQLIDIIESIDINEIHAVYISFDGKKEKNIEIQYNVGCVTVGK